jgi:S1-C subfamily serine protease
MNALDVVIVVAAIAAALGGWRLGFVARVFAWLGVALALVIGVRFVPRIVTSFGGTSADDRVTVAVLFLILLATVGQAVGLGVGLLVHRTIPTARPLPRWDRAAGAAVGALGVFVLVWMTIPSLATAKGWPARMARGSLVVEEIDRLAPEQPARFAAWGRAVSEAPYPAALGPLDDPPDPGAPPLITMSPVVDARVRAAVVKVTGRACRQIQDGSGWAVAPDLVVTNAHVVAGERDTRVEDVDGRMHDATVVAFDPKRDLAVLSVPGLAVTPLPLASGEVGTVGAVYGHPGGGPLQASPARVGEEILAVGTDIYRTGSSRRSVYVLAAELEPGDSGGALVDARGSVIGVAFAIDPGRDATSYALTDAEIRPVVENARGRGLAPADTGRCLVD